MRARGPAVVHHCQQLLKIDSSNPGPGEHLAAAYVHDQLVRAGAATAVIEPAPDRPSVISRTPGMERGGALLVHGHLDVVPADASEWTVDPFGGEILHGRLYGRGAVDMKHMVAMMLAAQLEIASGTLRSRRPLVFAYFADEEAGGEVGSRWIVNNRPEVLDGVTDALGEGGGHMVDVRRGERRFALSYAERGVVWIRVRIPRTAEHEPLGRLGQILTRLSDYTHGQSRSASIDLTPTVVEHAPAGAVDLFVDCRVPPYSQLSGIARLRGLLDEDMETEVVMQGPGHSAPRDGTLARACIRALRTVAPDSNIWRGVFPAGSDAENLARLGIRCYGFAPLPTEGPFEMWALAHGVDEFVPVAALVRGYEVFRELLATVGPTRRRPRPRHGNEWLSSPGSPGSSSHGDAQ